jgi:hypothetical protein
MPSCHHEKIYLKYHRHHQPFAEEDENNAAKAAASTATTEAHAAAAAADMGGGDRGHKQVPSFPMFHRVMKTGVIYATSRAAKYGFGASPDEDENGNDPWANMGQGAPETGPLPNAPARDFTLHIPDAEVEYAPVTGLMELREKVARYYNHLYRQDKSSQYTADNICIVPGGRAGITRIMVRGYIFFIIMYYSVVFTFSCVVLTQCCYMPYSVFTSVHFFSLNVY